MRYLETKVEDSSDADVVEQWQRNQALMRQQLLVEVGPADGQRKINDFMALEAAPWSVVAQHTHSAPDANQLRRRGLLPLPYRQRRPGRAHPQPGTISEQVL